MEKEKCPCETDANACCACVSMHCDECHKPNQSKFVQGRFCSNCGRPLKAKLTRLYVPKSEVDWNSIPVDVSEALKQRAVEKAKADVAREIFAEIEGVIGEKYEDYVFDNMEIEGVEQDAIIAFVDSIQKPFAELKKKYTEEET